MMRSRQSPPQSRKQGGLLSSRIWNSLPYVDSVTDFYLRKKQSNEALRFGLNIAEYCASTAVNAVPFKSRYEALDRFAGTTLDKLEEKYGEDLLKKSVTAIAYPVGYSLGLAGFARSKVMGIANPAVEMSYEWADIVIDKLLPPDSDESLEEEYRKMKHLGLKSPFSRIKERATINSLLNMPANALSLYWDVLTSGAYLGMGFTTMSLQRMFHTVDVLVHNINFVFEEVLQHPYSFVYNTDFSKLYHATLFYGVRYVNGYILELERLALDLSQYLEDRNLPYNSQVASFVAERIKLIERRLVKLGGFIQEANTKIEVNISRAPSQSRVHENSHRRIAAPDQRFPSMILGSTNKNAVERHQEKVQEITTDEHKEEEQTKEVHNLVYQLAAEKAKKEHKQAKKASASLHAKLAEASKKAKEVAPEEFVDPNADEFGFVPVRSTSHHHFTPISVAKELAQEIIEDEKLKHTHAHAVPVEVEAEINNPYGELSVGESKIISGPPRQVNLNEVAEHQKSLQHKALDELVHIVSERKLDDPAAMRAEERAELPSWEAPKHPGHVHTEEPAPEIKADEVPAVENNPFGKLAEVDASEDPLSLGGSSM